MRSWIISNCVAAVSTGLKLVNLTSEMLTYYGDAVDIPEYINMIYKYQKNVQRVQPTIPNVTLVDIATK